MITALSNNKIKEIKKLQEKKKERKESGLFTAEGIRIVSEIPFSLLKELYISEALYNDRKKIKNIEEQLGVTVPDLRSGAAALNLSSGENISIELVSDKVMETMCDTVTPQGLLAVIKMPEYDLSDLVGKKPAIIVLENLQDPGNLGTIMRTAEGAGMTGVILIDSVDIFSPKAVRATMGSIFRLPFVQASDMEKIISFLKDNDIRTYAAALGGRKKYTEEDFTGGTAFFIGNEGNGLSQETFDMVDEKMIIPMSGKLESLNAAMASGIIAYEIRRQRETL